PEVGPRLGGVDRSQAVVRVAGIMHLRQHGLEAPRRGLELPAVEMQDALVVAAVMAPLEEPGKECQGPRAPRGAWRPHGSGWSTRQMSGGSGGQSPTWWTVESGPAGSDSSRARLTSPTGPVRPAR